MFALLLIACGPSQDVQVRDLATPTSGFFVDVSDDSGMRVDNFQVDPPAGTAINDHSRLAFADIDGDGFDDMVMHSLYPNVQGGVPFEHLVFLNDGAGGFVDWSDASGLRDVHAAFFAFGDVDNDGDQDLFAGVDLPGGETGGIYRNDGSGRFALVPGTDIFRAYAATAVFADFDGDAVLDLFVGYGSTLSGQRDALYMGFGDGTFTESDALDTGRRQPSNGSVACDYDDDGDLDLFVSTYGVSVLNGHNHLWRNDGGGRFTEVGQEQGFASLPTGNYYLPSTGRGADPEPGADTDTFIGSNGFGIDCADANNDGRLDVLVTAISHPVDSDYSRKWSDPTHLLAGGEGGFTNEWLARGLPFNEGDVDGALVDFDNDGRLDVSLSRDRKYEGSYDDIDQKSWFGLMHQRADGDFDSLGYESGLNDPDEDLKRMKGAQNHAWSDIDRDGDLDLLVGGRDQGGGRPNFLFRNDIGDQNRFVVIRVEGDGIAVNRDGIGTRLVLSDGDSRVLREVKSSRGMYNSEDTRAQHFGLGTQGAGAVLDVRWPDGTTATFTLGRDFGDDQFLRLIYPDQLVDDAR